MGLVDESRYDRQIKLPQVGEAGQQRIEQSKILIIGMGGLGSPAALYLAAAGVGELIINDYDIVETSNLQRQIIHHDDQAGKLKTHSARHGIEAINPACKVTCIDYLLEQQDLAEIVKTVDIVLDCTDNFATRFAINRSCYEQHKPLVTAAAIRLEGQIMSVIPNSDGPCYQCLYPKTDATAATCEYEGVLGPVVGVMGTLQALQALLILLNQSEQLVGNLLLFDGMNMQWQQITLPKKTDCPICGK